ncbi:MAG: hypothetical protein RPU91_04080 [Candidatus Sedimenticola sp. (ex Thyasira tokunagai)]
MQNGKSKKIKLLSVGISTILAERVLNEGYSLTRLGETSKKDLIDLFGLEDGSFLFDKSRRKPIQSEVIHQLIEECYWSCCCCQNLDRPSGVVIHHIKHHSNGGGDEYDNLILLCPKHHEDAHSKSTLTRQQYPPDALVQNKSDWILTIKEWRDGKRPRPGRTGVLPSGQPPLLISLDDISKKSLKISSDVRLFDEGNVCFLPKEIELMDRVIKRLTSPGIDRLCAITGPPASGKSVIMLAIGRALADCGYKVFYLSIREDRSFEPLWCDIQSIDQPSSVVILDNAHLNISLVNDVYERYSSISSAACLIGMQNISTEVRKESDPEHRDFVSLLEEMDCHFDLSAGNPEHLEIKAREIATKKLAYLNAGIDIDSEVNKYIEASNSDLYLLNELLGNQEVLRGELSNFKSIASKFAWRKYFVPLTDSERENLIRFASVFQYEVPVITNRDNDKVARALVEKGYITYDDEYGTYSFYHPSFCKLLISAYEGSRFFIEKYRSRKDFIKSELSTYISNLHPARSNLGRLLSVLYMKREKSLYDYIVNSETLSGKLVEHFKLSPSVSEQISLLFNSRTIIGKERYRELGRQIVISNINIHNNLLRSDKPILYFVNLLKTLYGGDRVTCDLFFSEFDIDEQLKLVEFSDFSNISHSLRSWYKVDPKPACALFKRIRVDMLVTKAKGLSLNDLERGITTLWRVDRESTKGLYREIANQFCNDSKSIMFRYRFDEFAEVTNKLNRIDIDATQKLIRLLPVSDWTAMLSRSSIASAGYGLSLIKDIDFPTAQLLLSELPVRKLIKSLINTSPVNMANFLTEAHKIDAKRAAYLCSELDEKKISNKFKDVDIVGLGKILSEIAVIDERKAATLLESIDSDMLIDKLLEADLKGLSKSLNELNKFAPNVAKSLYSKYSIEELVSKSKNIPLEGLGRSLCELAKINTARTNSFYHGLDLNWLVSRCQKSTIKQLGHTLTELGVVDKQRTAELFQRIPASNLQKMLDKQEFTFLTLGTVVNQLSKVANNSTSVKGLLRYVSKSKINHMVKSGRFSEITVGLANISVHDKAFSLDIIESISARKMALMANEQSFEQVTQGIQAISDLNKDLASNVVSELNTEKLAQKAKNASIERMLNGLSCLSSYDVDYAKVVAQTIGIQYILSRAKQAKKSTLRQFPARLQAVIPELKRLCPAKQKRKVMPNGDNRLGKTQYRNNKRKRTI